MGQREFNQPPVREGGPRDPAVRQGNADPVHGQIDSHSVGIDQYIRLNTGCGAEVLGPRVPPCRKADRLNECLLRQGLCGHLGYSGRGSDGVQKRGLQQNGVASDDLFAAEADFDVGICRHEIIRPDRGGDLQLQIRVLCTTTHEAGRNDPLRNAGAHGDAQPFPV